MKNLAQDRPGKLYNIKQFENFLISEGATVDCPEFQLYKSLPVYGDEYGEEYYGVDEVLELMIKDQGPEFVRHTQTEVVQYWTPAGC